jgi:DNA-directed RNA polymerase specialized sigma24 family protein
LVKKLCAHLPPRLRDPFVLCSMEGWSQEELSRAYGVPIETIKSRIFRARCKLRKQWARHTQRKRAGKEALLRFH